MSPPMGSRLSNHLPKLLFGTQVVAWSCMVSPD
jgi:hypothetical protein